MAARNEEDSSDGATIDIYDKVGRRILSYTIVREDGTIGYPKCIAISEKGVIFATDANKNP